MSHEHCWVEEGLMETPKFVRPPTLGGTKCSLSIETGPYGVGVRMSGTRYVPDDGKDVPFSVELDREDARKLAFWILALTS